MPAAGSSSRSSFGPVASARAISRRRWLPYGRLVAVLVGDAVEAEDLQELHRPLGHLAFFGVVAAGPENGVGEHLAGPQMMRRQDVLENGHVGEEADVLERPRDAELRDLIGLLPVHARPVEMNFAFGRIVLSRQQVEDRGLARAVRADQSVQRALRDVDRRAP